MATYIVPVRIEIDKTVEVEAETIRHAREEAEKSAKNGYPEGYVRAFNNIEKVE